MRQQVNFGPASGRQAKTESEGSEIRIYVRQTRKPKRGMSACEKDETQKRGIQAA